MPMVHSSLFVLVCVLHVDATDKIIGWRWSYRWHSDAEINVYYSIMSTCRFYWPRIDLQRSRKIYSFRWKNFRTHNELPYASCALLFTGLNYLLSGAALSVSGGWPWATLMVMGTYHVDLYMGDTLVMFSTYIYCIPAWRKNKRAYTKARCWGNSSSIVSILARTAGRNNPRLGWRISGLIRSSHLAKSVDYKKLVCTQKTKICVVERTRALQRTSNAKHDILAEKTTPTAVRYLPRTLPFSEFRDKSWTVLSQSSSSLFVMLCVCVFFLNFFLALSWRLFVFCLFLFLFVFAAIVIKFRMFVFVLFLCRQVYLLCCLFFPQQS